MENFRNLGIIEPILKSIQDEKFQEPTEVQQKSIPLVVKGKDVIAGSATGSGKTLAFGSGIIQSCQKGAGIQALVLAPTRELAEQVSNDLRTYSKYKPLSIVSVYGGVSISPQMQALRTADVVVGTPGRILDHLRQKTLNLSKVKVLVLDEADRMLDMGFIDDVRSITGQCSRDRQTMMFSATVTRELKAIAEDYMNNPVRVSVECMVDPGKLEQVYYDIPDAMKFSLLVHLLKIERGGLVMVFCNSRNTTDFVATNLKACGIDAHAIHGGFSQDKRSRVIENFHEKDSMVLVCTDVAARGLHVEGISHVYNYDIPDESRQYVHRIGRTARAGSSGKAINILTQRDHENFSRVLRDNDVKVAKMERPYIEKVQVRNVPRSDGFGSRRQGFGPRRGFGPRQSGFGGRPSSSRFGNRRPGAPRGFGSRNVAN